MHRPQTRRLEYFPKRSAVRGHDEKSDPFVEDEAKKIVERENPSTLQGMPFNVDVLFVSGENFNISSIFSSYKVGRYRPGFREHDRHYSHDILPFEIHNLPVDLYVFELRSLKVPEDELTNLHFDNLVHFADFACVVLCYDARSTSDLHDMKKWYANYVAKSMEKYGVKPKLFVLCVNYYEKYLQEDALRFRGDRFADDINAEFWTLCLDDQMSLDRFFDRLAVVAFYRTMRRAHDHEVGPFEDPYKPKASILRGARSWGTFNYSLGLGEEARPAYQSRLSRAEYEELLARATRDRHPARIPQ